MKMIIHLCGYQTDCFINNHDFLFCRQHLQQISQNMSIVIEAILYEQFELYKTCSWNEQFESDQSWKVCARNALHPLSHG
jgi:hypothetical protein